MWTEKDGKVANLEGGDYAGNMLSAKYASKHNIKGDGAFHLLSVPSKTIVRFV